MGNAIITGAAHGIGAALARRFARAGHSVAVGLSSFTRAS